MKGIIYKITNKVNNKSYIGQTRYSIEFRWRQHIHKKDNTYFHNAIRKYGIENFTIEILEECDVEYLDSREIFYIAKYDTFANGYNLTIGGSGKKTLVLDDKYNEIKELYLSGFSTNKIASIYKVDKSSISKILKSLGVKLRSNALNINNQEFEELVCDYTSGYSLKELAKRYDCDDSSLKAFLIRKGIDVRNKYNILKDIDSQYNLIDDYLNSKLKVSEIQSKYHCSYATLLKVLSLHGISKGKKAFKLDAKEALEVIRLFNNNIPIKDIASKFNVNKSTIYSLLKRYGINYLTV